MSWSAVCSANTNAIAKGVASAWAAFKYALNPEEQATRLVGLIQSKSIPFTKRFVCLDERSRKGDGGEDV